MNPPRAVIFDLGKVLVDFDYSLAIGRLARAGSLDADSIRTMLFTDSLLVDFECGSMSSGEFFGRMQAAAELRLDYVEFRHAFGDIFQPIPPMVEAQAELRRCGIPTFIFSNTNEIAISHIRERYEFFGRFDGYVLSYEIGSMKPNAPIYEAVERRVAMSGRDLLYLDDRLENVEAASRRGWCAVLHSGPEAGLHALRESGLLA